MSFSPATSAGPFLPISEVFPEDADEFLVKLTNLYTQIAICVNAREIGVYSVTQSITGSFYPNPTNPSQMLPSYRKIFVFGAIPAGTEVDIPHGLTGTFFLIALTGSCQTDNPDQRPLPYPGDHGTDSVTLFIDSVDLVIANGTDGPNLNYGLVELEYIYI
jgi:hypothetical protein